MKNKQLISILNLQNNQSNGEIVKTFFDILVQQHTKNWYGRGSVKNHCQWDAKHLSGIVQ